MFDQGNGLVSGREESITPVGFSIGWFAPNVLDGDVGGEVIVVAAQRVTGPGTSGRETFGGMSGVDEDTAGTVGVGFGMKAMEEGNIVNVLGQVWQHGGDHFP